LSCNESWNLELDLAIKPPISALQTTFRMASLTLARLVGMSQVEGI
jgi:hypothetical protein